MKTRKLTLCAFAAIAALATACSNDELAGNDTPRKGIVIEATGTAPRNGADTRLTHKDVNDMEIVWAAGDDFTAYASSTNKTTYNILDKDAGNASASFTATWSTEPSGRVYAIYPSNTTSDPAAIPLSLLGQDGTLDNLTNFNYMTASATYQKDQSLSFSFAHQVAIVKLVMSFPTGVTGSASNIGLKATGLNKSANLNLTDGTGTFSNKTPGDVTTGANTIAIGVDNKLTAYLCVFSGSLTDAKAIAKVGSDDYEADLSDLSVAAGSMYTATVTMKKIPATEWAPGNLVADGKHGAKIGTATDKGLYFQFGSLVGWSETGSDPTVAVSPVGYTGSTTWNEDWQGDPTTENVATGTGDPCKYYLKGTWRLPTKGEYATLFNNVTDKSYANSGGWSWDNATKSATHSTKNLTLPAAGCRSVRDGSLNLVGTSGYYWSASPYNASDGYYLLFGSSNVNPSSLEYRMFGFPVRCVQNASN